VSYFEPFFARPNIVEKFTQPPREAALLPTDTVVGLKNGTVPQKCHWISHAVDRRNDASKKRQHVFEQPSR
jgi:hypothetical protein